MAALVQTFPAQQSSTPVALMQPRSQSSSGTNSQPQPGHHTQHQTTPRYTNNANSNTGYRNGFNTAPVAPYAFTSTPGLANPKPAATAPRLGERTSSAPAGGRPDELRQGYSESQIQQPPSGRAVDDSNIRTRPQQNLRPLSTVGLPAPQSLSSPTTRPSPDRYRRVNRRSEVNLAAANATTNSSQPSGSGMAAVAAVYSVPNRASSNPSLPQGTGNSASANTGAVKAPFIGDYTGQLRGQSVDDLNTYVHPSQQSIHNRRRSVGPGSITTENFQTFLRQELANNKSQTSPKASSPSLEGNSLQLPVRPRSRRAGSTDSSGSGASSKSSQSHRNSFNSTSSTPTNSTTPMVPAQHEINMAHVPPRGSSSDITKRTTAPSPLSRPVNISSDTPSQASKPEGERNSPAAEQLAALNDEPRKGMKNRLRRAFSFGSAAELRKASAHNSLRGEEAAERARQRQERFRDEQDAEQERIAKRQEEAGLGESIYSGQGNFFMGSTDNISVSSTASSASIIMRKMGKGVKKSTRSLVGLFRPKSVTGVPPASGPVSAEASTGQVSMITVEAEREKVNVNVNAREQTGGGTGFPKLERNSLDMGRNEIIAEAASNDNRGRRSIVGGEKERAEILASMKKGILKRPGSASPVARPADTLPSQYQLPQIPGIGASQENQRPGSNQRTTSLKAEGEDYFMSGPKFPANGMSNSAPSSPNSLSRYNVSFSPRITFHETWPSGEYDRRGEIATCNRLTPMLAQQIKEELNTFKMEMDVHEESKVYTHFF